jgi:hypothetical protein
MQSINGQSGLADRVVRPARGYEGDIYIGLGTLVLILVIVMIVYFLRRA